MVRTNILNDALRRMVNAETRNKREVIIQPSSNLILNVLHIMRRHGYIGEIEHVIENRVGRIQVELHGRLTQAGVVSPRHEVCAGQVKKWTEKLLPSRQYGYVVLTTSSGVLDHEEAQQKRVGGQLLGFFY